MKILPVSLLGLLLSGFVSLATCSAALAADLATFQVAGDWTVDVSYANATKSFEIQKPTVISVTDEKYASLPLFNEKGPSWRKAQPLKGVAAFECCVFDALVPGSVTLQLEDGTILEDGKDYKLDVRSGNVGRLEGGKLAESTAVLASYQYVPQRLDGIFRNSDGSIVYVPGTPHVATPVQAEAKDGQTRLGNVYISGRIEKLDDSCLFPILEMTTNPVPPSNLALTIPETLRKLADGKPVRILAWGDSVTACGFLPDNERWQAQFCDRLQKKYPNAKIELLTEAWGGRATMSYKNEPAGSPKNYQEKVLDLKPDLIVSEFVNDAYLSEAQVDEIYGKTLADFQAIGAEWIILTPHYVRPDWMRLDSQKNCDQDPRPYVAGLKQFAAKRHVALADGSFKYGQLYRLGIPYNTLMTNNINHPNAFGMSLFADALMELFDAAKKPFGVGTNDWFKGPVGVNMYSYRDIAKDDLAKAMDYAAETGFHYIECSNPFGHSLEEYRDMLTARGLKPVSRNFGFSDWENKLEETIQQAQTLGVKYAGTAWIPFTNKSGNRELTEAEVRHAADVINKAAGELAKRGMKFSIHNHGQEFAPLADGKTMFDLLMELTDPENVKVEMDVTWVIHPWGANPVEIIKKYPNRIRLLHVKDFKQREDGKYGGSCPVGEGCANMKAVLEAAQEAGVEFYHIEDEASQPLKDIPQSLRNMEAM